jgi:serine/threonine-protein kinase
MLRLRMERITQTPAEAFVGRTIAGKYRLLEKIGEGAMGAVYEALDADARPCAVKMMHARAVADPALRTRFEREAQALFSLRHPNVLEVRDYGVEAGLPFLVMERLSGRTLEEMVVEHTPDPQTGVELAKQVLRGLAFAHAHGVLHRDIKSENVFVTWNGREHRCVLLDFGLVKLDDSKHGPSEKLTMDGSVMGSPAYMSPEQGTGQPVDARTDVYAMGVVLYELVTGEWPFSAESQIEMFRMHLVERPPEMESQREHLVVAPGLEAIVQKALAKAKADRWQDAGEMLAALEALPSPSAWLDPTGRSRPSAVSHPGAHVAASSGATSAKAAAPAATSAPSAVDPMPGRNTLTALIVGVFLLATLFGGGLLWFFTR